MTMSVLDAFQSIQTKAKHDAALLNYKGGDMSSKRIKEHFGLSTSNPEYIAFSKVFDEVTKDAVLSIYGSFSPFTQPILDRNQIVHLCNEFKTKLPKYYEIVSILLAKSKYQGHERWKHMQQLWDQLILFTFCMLMRIRNDHNYTWWGLINAAAMYGDGANNLAVFFGFSVHSKTIVSKLEKAGLTYDKIMVKARRTLKLSGSFGLAVFDNSMNIQELKFQRNKTSSEVSLTTSRFFLQPVVPSNLYSIKYGTERAEITYLNQMVPSPFGFPAFELDHTITSDSFNPNGMPECNLDVDVDISGMRVEAYAKRLQIAAWICKLKKLVPISMENPFKFQHEANNIAMETLGICDLLSTNRIQPSKKEKSYYSKIESFQRETVDTWRGEVHQASLLLPPVSHEDETTNLGAAKVVLSLLVMYGIFDIDSNEGSNGEVKGLRLADGYEDRYLMLVGDGLSQIRVELSQQ